MKTYMQHFTLMRYNDIFVIICEFLKAYSTRLDFHINCVQNIFLKNFGLFYTYFFKSQ